MTTLQVDTAQESQLVANLQRLCGGLRAAGLPVGTGQLLAGIHSLLAVGVERPDDVRIALRANLVSNPAHFGLFDAMFDRCLLQAGHTAPGDHEQASHGGGEALQSALALPPHAAVEADAPPPVANSGECAEGTASHREVLAGKDFAIMTPAERQEVQRMLHAGVPLLDAVPTRRYAPAGQGAHIDPQRTLRRMLRDGGELIRFARRERRQRRPAVVLLCDISGSMSDYSRPFLLFAHALAQANRHVHAFAFGTRLTNVSRRLRQANTDLALAQIAADVRDWDGGTRIAACLADFNRRWGRRVAAGNATVILLTDGFERDPGTDLAFQVQRLRGLCRELVWINPMLRYVDFAPRAHGIRQMLPHVDRFLPAHNVASLLALCRIVGKPRGTVTPPAARWR